MHAMMARLAKVVFSFPGAQSSTCCVHSTASAMELGPHNSMICTIHNMDPNTIQTATPSHSNVEVVLLAACAILPSSPQIVMM